MDALTFETAMSRALELSTRGPARGPNPRVGCVILSADGETLAEGWHRGAGTAHAEVDALSQLGEGGARGATAVVTLEPCNHTGRTGPCSEALIAAGVARVVYSVADPGEHSGGGAERLRAAGVEVIPGVRHAEVEAYLADWLFAARHRRPFTTLKWAASLDGRTAAADGSSRWITGPAARARVHEQRRASDAILVGTGTVLADDPSLTARGEHNELLGAQPTPVVLGLRGIPDDAAVWRHPHPPIVLKTHDLAEALHELQQRGIRSLYVEAGPTLASAFVTAGLVDEFAVYLAPTLIGGPRTALTDLGVASIDEQRRLELRSVERLADDLLITARPVDRGLRTPASGTPAADSGSGN
ncbi:MAG TPA: bifunctional diaminohydroxyphosphoribosylaminopyrimidine deaminase/5-amino-6-(5-phosphoribosylamino)uracil reductase RibD [Gryllotalpicola sp.]